MFVRITKLAFVNGALRHPGQIVKLREGQKPSKKCMEVLESAEGLEVEPDPEREDGKGKTKKQVMLELDAAEIAYSPRATKNELSDLLDQALALKVAGGKVIPPRDPMADLDDESVI